METFYKVTMECQNPSANCSGYFSTKDEADNAIAAKKKSIAQMKSYFGKAEFNIQKIPLDVAMD